MCVKIMHVSCGKWHSDIHGECSSRSACASAHPDLSASPSRLTWSFTFRVCPKDLFTRLYAYGKIPIHSATYRNFPERWWAGLISRILCNLNLPMLIVHVSLGCATRSPYMCWFEMAGIFCPWWHFFTFFH